MDDEADAAKAAAVVATVAVMGVVKVAPRPSQRAGANRPRAARPRAKGAKAVIVGKGETTVKPVPIRLARKGVVTPRQRAAARAIPRKARIHAASDGIAEESVAARFARRARMRPPSRPHCL